MEFTSARAIEQLCWQMKLADYPRGLDRARIDSLANGAPPYPESEVEASGIEVNVNNLTMTRQLHEARMQLYQAFNKPNAYFSVETDAGSQSRREERGITVTKLINRYMKRSMAYYETKRSKFAMLVAHGIGPCNWADQDNWKPQALQQADILIPSRTLLTLENLPFFAIFRAYTPAELRKLTENVTKSNNPGWNLPVLKRALEWADEQTAKLYGGTTWAEYWAPEKREDRFKEDSGVYASDLAQTIDVWDFYYWDDAQHHQGWRRRMVFDAHGGHGSWSGIGGYGEKKQLPDRNLLNSRKGQFLFTSGNRVVADRITDILHFQFADLSAVAPFKYHSVRSLGFLLYAVCHLQNRLHCSFSEAVFENLMMYMRVSSLDEAERALKIELSNRGIIDPSVQFLRPDERWQPDPNMAMLGMNEFKQIIQDSGGMFAPNQNWSRDRVEKTKFQVMAEVNAMQTLISSALQQAYHYEIGEYENILSRFMRKNSSNADVRDFRARAIAAGIPDSMLIAQAWNVQPERVWGAGNKTMEMTIAQQLMEWRAAFSPDAQQKILRKATLAITDDAEEALALVPHAPTISRAKHDAMIAIGSMMVGGRVTFQADQNELEVCDTLLAELGIMVEDVLKEGGMTSEDKVAGFQNVLAHIGVLLSRLQQDKVIAEKVKSMMQLTSQITNHVKGMQQRIMQQKQAQQDNGGGEQAKVIAKIQADKMMAEAKAANTRESHAQRTAQRQAQSEVEAARKEQEHQQEMRHRSEDHAVDVALKQAEAEAMAESKPREAGSAPDSKQGG